MIEPLARRALQCHPHTRCDVQVEVEIGIDGDALVVRYRIVGELARLRIPVDPLDPDRLWAHTCCELFVAPQGGDAYVEHNFSPNGQIARFDFSGYRQRAPSSPTTASSSTSREADALVLVARAPLPTGALALRVSTTAVIEDEHGALSYWALRHPSDRPDFHDPGGFALSLTLGAAPAIVDA